MCTHVDVSTLHLVSNSSLRSTPAVGGRRLGDAAEALHAAHLWLCRTERFPGGDLVIRSVTGSQRRHRGGPDTFHWRFLLGGPPLTGTARRELAKAFKQNLPRKEKKDSSVFFDF